MSSNTTAVAGPPVGRRFRIYLLAIIVSTVFILLAGHQFYAHQSNAKQPDLILGSGQTEHSTDQPESDDTPEKGTVAEGVEESGSTITSAIATAASAFQSASALPLPSLKAGDPKLLQDAPRYIQAIMDSTDQSFPRLSCPVPAGDRYEYLRAASVSAEPDSPKQAQGLKKYFFALDLYQCAPLLPRLLGSIVETIRFLGPENCALSIVEGRSTDGTYEILLSLRDELERLGAQYYLNSSDVNPKEEGTNRIEALAGLRNQALQPLVDNAQDYAPDSTVLFINDVSLCMEDILELAHQRIKQKADMTCAMDWIFGGSTFYDVWVSRGINGDLFFEVPQTGTWDFAENLFWDAPKIRARFDARVPFQVFACWNGATAFTASPIISQKIQFRANYEGECYMGEPTLFCKDLWHNGLGKIAVIPSVNVGYSDEESAKVKQRQGYVSRWARQEKEENLLVDWQAKPPSLIKCVPTYQHPSWVASDQALAQHDKTSA